MNLFRKHDWIITVVTWVLVALSITTIYSITYAAESAIYGAGTANRQFIFALVGLGVFFFISLWLDYTYFKNLTVLGALYIVVLGLLVLVMIISQANRGSVRWISVGPFNIEPSELAKILVILISSASFSKRFDGKLELKDYLIRFLPILPILGLVFIQPDLSTTLSLIFIVGAIFISSAPNIGNVVTSIVIGALSFFSTFLVIGDYNFFNLIRLSGIVETLKDVHWVIVGASVLLSGLIILLFKKKNYVMLLLSFILGIGLAFGYTVAWNHVLKDYQKERINTFINPEADPLGAGYQVNQSMIAAGSGQIWGRGFGRGTQSNLNFLPERHTDFIFASYAEEFGFVGSMILIGLYFILLIRIVQVGVSSKDPQGFLICVGVAAMIFFQFTVNIGMNIGIMPVTGITLPLFSYGGSSMLTTLLAIAIVQSVANGRELVNMEDSLVIRETVQL